MKFAENGQLYRGSKPVMWSVVEKTALAEAEVEYEDYTSDTILGEVPGTRPGRSAPAHRYVVIWTTTPWTIPGNRAISFHNKIAMASTRSPAPRTATGPRSAFAMCWPRTSPRALFKTAKVEAYELERDVTAEDLAGLATAHPLRGSAAMSSTCRCSMATMSPTMPAPASCTPRPATAARTSTSGWQWPHAGRARHRDPIPYTVDADGRFTADAPGFEGKRVITDKGEKGDANEVVIKALAERPAISSRAAASSTSIRIPGARRSR
jgi:isoleucyl-tRNA synthetase